MFRQVIAHVLIIVKLLCPRIRIIQNLLTERLLRQGNLVLPE